MNETRFNRWLQRQNTSHSDLNAPLRFHPAQPSKTASRNTTGLASQRGVQATNISKKRARPRAPWKSGGASQRELPSPQQQPSKVANGHVQGLPPDQRPRQHEDQDQDQDQAVGSSDGAGMVADGTTTAEGCDGGAQNAAKDDGGAQNAAKDAGVPPEDQQASVFVLAEGIADRHLRQQYARLHTAALRVRVEAPESQRHKAGMLHLAAELERLYGGGGDDDDDEDNGGGLSLDAQLQPGIKRVPEAIQINREAALKPGNEAFKRFAREGLAELSLSDYFR